MKMHRLFYRALVIFLYAILSGCATEKFIATDEPPEIASEDPIDSSCSYFYFLWGTTAEYNSNYAEALEAYEKANICDPQADYIAEKIPTLLIRLGRLKEAEVWLENYISDKPTKTVQRFMLARLKIQEGKDDEALKLFQEALDIEPDNTSIRLRLGLLHAQKGEYERAETIFKNVLANNQESYFATLYLARLYTQSGNLQAADKHYQEALMLNWSKELAFEIAEFYNIGKQYSQAQDMYKVILKRDPQDERAALGIVQSYIYLKDGEAAIEELSKIRRFSKNPERIDLIRSQILVNMGETERAKKVLLEILKGNTLSQANYLLGVVLYEELSFERAMTALQKITPQDPEYKESIMLQVRILEETDRSADSIDLLEKVISTEQTRQPPFFSLLAAIYRRHELTDKALETLSAAVTLYPENEKLLYEYAILHEKIGNHSQAMELMKKLLSLNINHADALNFIGYSWADKNIKLDEAYEYIRKALELKPQSGYIQDSLGWVYYRMGALEKAKTTLLKAVESEPEDPYIYEHLGDVYRALDDKKEALQYYDKALKLLKDPESIEGVQQKIKELHEK
jgi:tetratricopeptide (TPR) repeat protein